MALLHALVHVASDALGDVELGEMCPGPFDQLRQALLDVDGLEQPELLFVCQIRGVARQVGQFAGVSDALHRVDDLPGAALLEDRHDDALVLPGELAHGLTADDVVEDLGFHPERRSRPSDSRAHTGTSHGPQHRGRLPAGQLAQLLDLCYHANGGVIPV